MVGTTAPPSAARAARELRTVVGRLRRRLLEVYDARDLTASQLSVLSRLGKEGDASASDLAAAERITPQSVSATLAVLARRELVERRPDPADGRRQLLSLSPAGRAVFDDRRRASQEWLTRALSEQFTEDERRRMLDALRLLERLTR